MIASYFKVALRHLSRSKGYAFINVAGLAIGMACCLLIALYIQHETGYERHHKNADRIVRVALDATLGETELQSAMSARPLAAAMETELPGVQLATRLWRDRSGDMTVFTEDREFLEDRVLFADANVFDVFSFPLLIGDPTTALQEPNTVVLTSETARRYFGDEDPIGRTLSVREPSDRDVFTYTVTGVAQNLPSTSHIQFDFLASYITQRGSRSDSWLGFGVYTYAVLRKGSDASRVEAMLPALVARHAAPQVAEEYGVSYDAYTESGQGYRYFLQPISSIHLDSALDDELGPNGNRAFVVVFGFVALFILLIACINFMNLATARSAERAKEVGIRKVLGADQSRLVTQFLAESTLLSLASVVVAAAIVSLVLRAFGSLSGIALSITSGTGSIIVILLALACVVGVLAGSYPALYLSRFQPAVVLKKAKHDGSGLLGVRNVLVVLQFTVSIILIAGTVVVYRQVDFLRSKNLGFDTHQVVVLNGAEVMGRQAEAFRETLRGFVGVESVTNSEKVPGRPFDGALFRMEGRSEDEVVALDYTYASFDFVETLGINVIEGRSLERGRAGDSLGVILNETAVARLGIEDPIGKRLVWGGESTYTIVGVVADFHIASLHHPITPVALLGPDPRNTNRPNLLVAARVSTDGLPTTLAQMEATWKTFAPRQPFNYSFLNQDFDRLYRSDRVTGRLIGVFAVIALAVACIGLFGLAAFTAERRTKEVGIRKVLGASVPQIVGLLSRDFLKLVGVAFVIAAPIAYLGMDGWLEAFAYRTNIGLAPFVIGGLFTLVIALVTVGYQSARAARANPISSLRYE